MAEYVVSLVVNKIGNLLIEEVNLLSGVSEQVKQLQEELKRMQCILKDAEKRQDESVGVQNLVSEIREAAYDAENIIESFAFEAASEKGAIQDVLKRYAYFFNRGTSLHKAGHEIEAIKAKISDLTRNLQTYGIDFYIIQGEGSSFMSGEQQLLGRSYPYFVEEHIVGYEEDVKKLVTELVNEENYCGVVSICGMGGIGKTTLAKMVYHHSDIKRHFESFAWACISQQFKTRSVWETILFQLIFPSNEERGEILKLKDEELVQKLYQVLQEKRCLVILDDIWSTEAWDMLRPAFPDLKKGSKILLTTRNRKVVLHVDLRGFIHEPQFLNEDESWELFRRNAFAGKDPDFNIDKTMEELGKNMVYHCHGLPLAIALLARMLATQYSSNEWQMVKDNIQSCYRPEQMRNILWLSYVELPMWLRPCFLYLSQFPEGYEINVNKLTRLWIAEGFVQPALDQGDEEMLEDLAECYLNELMLRYMVLAGEKDANLRIKTCRLHPLMRDLCLSKAQYESFHHIINYRQGDDVGLFSSSSTSRILAIHLHGHSCQFPLDYITSPNLRSLLCFYDYDCSDERWRLRKPIFDKLKLLKVLDLEGADVGEGNLLKDVGKLVFLRFLSLRHARVSMIPSSIGNLRYLQTLDLLIGGIIVHVPNVIWKMERLRHLYLPEFCDANTKLQLYNLKNLLTLVNFPARNCDVRDLFSMINLRELTIRDPISINNFTKFSKSLSIRLKHLRALSLDNSYEEDDGEATKFKDLRSMSFGDFTVPSI